MKKVLLISENVAFAKHLGGMASDNLIYYDCPGDAMQSLMARKRNEFGAIFLDPEFSENTLGDVIAFVRKIKVKVPIVILAEEGYKLPPDAKKDNVTFVVRDIETVAEEIERYAKAA